ncbi:MAG: hypothetical protein PHX47_01155 [Candidatus ainarchaeum sp.]|jgi:hypothetical protein|nr:hypothetical protein [Candidatus ainarchaeum sp.]
MTKNLDEIDKAIKQMILDFARKNKLEKSEPVNLNIQFNRDKDDFEMCDDIDSFVFDKESIYLTMYTPHNLNKIRFDVDDERNILMIRSHDFSFYKEVWLGFKVIKESIVSSYKNNILEIKLSIDNL